MNYPFEEYVLQNTDSKAELLKETKPFCFSHPFFKMQEIKKWAKETGLTDNDYEFYLDGDDCYSHTSVDVICFAHEEHAMAFKLKFF